jgi:hypothetical protein
MCSQTGRQNKRLALTRPVTQLIRSGTPGALDWLSASIEPNLASNSSCRKMSRIQSSALALLKRLVSGHEERVRACDIVCLLAAADPDLAIEFKAPVQTVAVSSTNSHLAAAARKKRPVQCGRIADSQAGGKWMSDDLYLRSFHIMRFPLLRAGRAYAERYIAWCTAAPRLKLLPQRDPELSLSTFSRVRIPPALLLDSTNQRPNRL